MQPWKVNIAENFSSQGHVTIARQIDIKAVYYNSLTLAFGEGLALRDVV